MVAGGTETSTPRDPTHGGVDLALLKAGRYRSAAQYYAVAKAKHIEVGFDWTQQLDLARSQEIRSIPRGMDPATAKMDWMFDNITASFAEQPLRMEEPFATSLTAIWFLLRGIEIANLVRGDVRFNRSEVVFPLRVSITSLDACM